MSTQRASPRVRNVVENSPDLLWSSTRFFSIPFQCPGANLFSNPSVIAESHIWWGLYLFLQIAWGPSCFFLLSGGSHTCLTPSVCSPKWWKTSSSLSPLGDSVFLKALGQPGMGFHFSPANEWNIGPPNPKAPLQWGASQGLQPSWL